MVLDKDQEDFHLLLSVKVSHQYKLLTEQNLYNAGLSLLNTLGENLVFLLAFHIMPTASYCPIKLFVRFCSYEAFFEVDLKCKDKIGSEEMQGQD